MKRILSLLVLTLCFTYCRAQRAGELASPPPPPPVFEMQPGEDFIRSCVVIYNNSDTRTVFLLGEISRMDTITLKSHENWISSPLKFNPVFRIHSAKGTISYQLTRGNFYTIFWNPDKECWDLSKIVRDQ